MTMSSGLSPAFGRAGEPRRKARPPDADLRSVVPMHVGIFTVRDLTIAGGSLIRIVGTTQHLGEMGCEPTLFAPNLAAQLNGRVRFVPLEGAHGRNRLSNWYTAYPRLLTPTKLFLSDRSLAALIRNQKLDLIHAHQHPAGFRLLRIAHRIGIPIVMDVHGILKLQEEDHRAIASNPMYVPSLLRMERHLFRRIHALTVRTEAERAYIVKHFAIPAQSVYVVPDAADVEFLGHRIPPAELCAFRAELGIDGKRVILFGGEFKSQSGLLDLLDAYRMLAARRDDVALLLVGDGVLMPAVQEIVQRHALRDVVLCGRQSRERFRLCQQIADVVVTPEIPSTYNELAVPLKLLDCLASGRPTVATRIASHVPIIEDGRNGFLVEPGDPAGMARGIERALDAGTNSDVGRQGRATAVRDHSWRASTAEALRAYDAIVSSTGRRTVSTPPRH